METQFLGSYLRRLMLCLLQGDSGSCWSRGDQDRRSAGESEGKYKQGKRRRETGMVQGSER